MKLLAFDEPAFFGIEERSNRHPERNRKLQHHIDLLNNELHQDPRPYRKSEDLLLDFPEQLSLAFETLCTNTIG